MNPASEAPKDGTVILGNFGFPFLMPAVYSHASENWHAAKLAVNTYRGKTNDWFFGCEYFDDSELEGWIDCPCAVKDCKK